MNNQIPTPVRFGANTLLTLVVSNDPFQKILTTSKVSMEVSNDCKLVYKFRGLITYFHRGYDPVTKCHRHPSSLWRCLVPVKFDSQKVGIL